MGTQSTEIPMALLFHCLPPPHTVISHCRAAAVQTGLFLQLMDRMRLRVSAPPPHELILAPRLGFGQFTDSDSRFPVHRASNAM